MKKIFLAFFIISLSVLLFLYNAELFQMLKKLEDAKKVSPFLVAGILILIKTFVTPLGFPGTPLTLLTGSLFGYFFGTIISLIGNTLGACLAFLLARYVLQEFVQKKLLPRYIKIKKYEQNISKRGLATVIALRLIPLFPFNALNFLLGVTSISFKKYMWGSFIGMIPGTFLFVYFGESLRLLSFLNILLAITGIIILTYLGKLYEKRF